MKKSRHHVLDRWSSLLTNLTHLQNKKTSVSSKRRRVHCCCFFFFFFFDTRKQTRSTRGPKRRRRRRRKTTTVVVEKCDSRIKWSLTPGAHSRQRVCPKQKKIPEKGGKTYNIYMYLFEVNEYPALVQKYVHVSQNWDPKKWVCYEKKQGVCRHTMALPFTFNSTY
jgi:hypothetical protein